MSNNIYKHIPSLDSKGNKSTQEDRWLADLVHKAQPIHDGGIFRHHIVKELRNRDFHARTVLAYETCSNLTRKHYCTQCDHEEESNNPCNNRLCPVCERGRRRRLNNTYEKHVKQLKQPKILTVTIGQIAVNYGDCLTYWSNQFYKLLRKINQVECSDCKVIMVTVKHDVKGEKKYVCRSCEEEKILKNDKKIEAGLVSLEMGKGGSWHFHALIDTPYFLPQDELAQHWREITGYTREVVHIKRVTNWKKAYYYVTKYIVKTPEFESTHQYADFMEITHNRRLLRTVGRLYRLKKTVSTFKRYCRECGGDILSSRESIYIEHQFILDYFKHKDNIP